ncbi:MAG: GxxExxY protein [Candidatus Doudnabacteria bacterium]|nr:GxxExxY protein [Candidatus Doudnabacteria bacterium]
MKAQAIKQEILYPELSYNIIGVLIEVFRELGSKYQEKYYQRAVAVELKKRNIKYLEQVKVPLEYKSESIGHYYLDFLIEDKVILEIKKNKPFSYKDIEQTLSYLKALDLQLGILANFTSDGVKFKRIVNIV